jgi:hypothetical protein
MQHTMQLLYLVVGQSFQERVMMTTCKNCGHESHCGVTLTKEFRKERDKGPEGSIEVCKNCRCEKCSRPDWG